MIWIWLQMLWNRYFAKKIPTPPFVKSSSTIEERAVLETEKHLASVRNPRIIKLCPGKRHAWCDIGTGELVRLRVRRRQEALV